MTFSNQQEVSGKARPRGSRSGLVAWQVESATRTSAALSKALEELRSSHPKMHITERALCKLAGLKSTIALHSTANSECLGELRKHNQSLKVQPTSDTLVHTQNSKDRDELILRQDAEISYLLTQNQKLKRQVKNLKARLATVI